VYYITADVKLPGYNGYCVFEMRADAEILLRREYYYDQAALCGPFYASGLFAAAAAKFVLTYTCYNDGIESLETWAAFDNLALFIYPASTIITVSTSYTPTPTPNLAARQLLVNNDFASGDLSPWEPDSRGDGATFGVVNGRATTNHTSSTDQAGFYQFYTPDVEPYQSVRIQIDVYIDIPSDGTSCTAYVWSGVEFWAKEVFTSQNFSLDLRQDPPLGASFMYMYAACTDIATVAFDNVYLSQPRCRI